MHSLRGDRSRRSSDVGLRKMQLLCETSRREDWAQRQQQQTQVLTSDGIAQWIDKNMNNGHPVDGLAG